MANNPKLFSRRLVEVLRPEWLDSDSVRLKTAGVTLLAAAFPPDAEGVKIVPSGMPVGKNAAGRYVAADGTTVNAEFLTFTDVDLTRGDAEVVCMDWGRVLLARLPAHPGDRYRLDIGAATGGTFRLVRGAVQTDPLAHNASAPAVQRELERLYDVGQVTVTKSGTVFTITFTIVAKDLTAVLTDLTYPGGTTPNATFARLDVRNIPAIRAQLPGITFVG